jgi:broad specificity phosphatase PhoE
MSADSLLDDDADDSLLGQGERRNAIQGCIYLMRHGSTVLDVSHRSDGFLDFPLSDQGRLSLIAAQQYLKKIPLAAIYEPGLKRTAETAYIVKSGTLTDPPVHTEPAAKTWNLGILAGTRKRYGRPEVQKLIDSPGSAPPGGESFSDFQSRFLPWFQKIAKQVVKSGKPVLIVCSGSNLRLLGQTLCGDPDELDMDEGGLAELDYIGGRWHSEVLLGAEDASQEIS